jgi:hypothetical protein
MSTRTCCTAVLLTAVTALSGVAGASAKAPKRTATTASHAKVVKRTAVSRTKSGTGAVRPVRTSGPSVAAISAFPAGGKGSGTEATCALWSQRLQEDQQIIDDAPETDKDDASAPLEADVDNALDAGCAVIY